MYVIRNRTSRYRVSKKENSGRGVVRKAPKSVVPDVVSSVTPLLNRAVDALPVELDFPGYKFCGTGTKREERLARGERGINELNEACRKQR